MIRINLLPIRQIKAEVSRRREIMIGGVSLAVTGVLLLGLYQFQSYRLSNFEKELAKLREEISVLNQKVKEVSDLQSKIKEYQSKNAVIQSLSTRKTGPVNVMESLSAAVPPTLWITEFKETGGSLTISGMAADNQTVADFLEALSRFSHFNNVELVETSQIERDNMSLKKFLVRSIISYQMVSPKGEEKNAPGSKSEG